MNWDDLRYVLALAKAGSLARAARALKVDHTTVGRRVEAMEAHLGVRLFTRTTAGYVVTQEAEALLPGIHQVESAVLAVQRGAHARGEALAGSIRITAPEAIGSRYLSPRLTDFTRRHPGVTLELMTGSHTFDLSRREADVALRLFRSKHEHLVVRRAGNVAYALYASEGYLRRKSTPSTPASLCDHDLLVDDAPPGVLESVWMQRLAKVGRVALLTNSTSAIFEAAIAGAGIGVLPCFLGDTEPSLRHVPMPDEPVRGMWLTVHRDLQHTGRVRAILDYLAEVIRSDDALLLGRSRAPRS